MIHLKEDTYVIAPLTSCLVLGVRLRFRKSSNADLILGKWTANGRTLANRSLHLVPHITHAENHWCGIVDFIPSMKTSWILFELSQKMLLHPRNSLLSLLHKDKECGIHMKKKCRENFSFRGDSGRHCSFLRCWLLVLALSTTVVERYIVVLQFSQN